MRRWVCEVLERVGIGLVVLALTGYDGLLGLMALGVWLIFEANFRGFEG